MIDLRDFIQQAIVDALAWTLLHFLWQGALLGFAAFFLLTRRAAGSRRRRDMRSASPRSALMLVTCVATFAILAAQPRRAAIARSPTLLSISRIDAAVDDARRRDGERRRHGRAAHSR